MKIKTGFTLAEVLITLGIIGVVAAMTIPTLIANTNAQKYRSKFKKSISTLSQAARMSQAQYGFDYAGVSQRCGANAANENPETTQSVCALINGTLTAATHYANITDIKTKNNQNYSYIKGDFLSYSGREPDKFQAYILSDGTIIAFAKMFGTYPCTLSIGKVQTDVAAGELIGCTAFIDVNGPSLPNKEVSCSSGSNSLTEISCVVKNDSKHMTDIYPIRLHDGIAEPATAAARYVLKTAK